MGEDVADINMKMVEQAVQEVVVRVVHHPVVRPGAHLQQQLDLEMRVVVLEVHLARRRVRAVEVAQVVWVFIHTMTALKHREDRVWRTQFQEVQRLMQREARVVRETLSITGCQRQPIQVLEVLAVLDHQVCLRVAATEVQAS